MQLLEKIFSEYGLIASMFVFLIWTAVRFIPKAVDKHFDLMDKTHERFSEDLQGVTNKFTTGLDKLVEKVSEEHGKQNQILDKISKHQDVILDEVRKRNK